VPQKNLIDVLVTEPDGSARMERITPTLDAIKELIGGGWLEAVSGSMGEWVAYGDEEGNLKGMTPNGLAAGLIQAIGGNPVLPVGTIAFVGMRWVGGEDGYVEGPLPQKVIDLMFPGGGGDYQGADRE
jgi:hypothetical protein